VGAKTVGRGAAWITGVDDLTAIYLNPAGLAHIRGVNFMLVNNIDIFHTAYRRSPLEPTVRNENPADIIQFAALSSNFGLERWTFAIGLYGPYGVSERYDLNGPQRYQAVEIKRGQVYYMAGFGWGPTDWLRVGAGVGIGEFSEQDTYAFTPFDDSQPQNDVIAHVKIRQIGNVMYATGVQLGPFNGFELGFSYQPPTDVKLQGKIKAFLPPLYAAAIGEEIYRDDMTVNLNFPQIIRFGARQRITPRFDLELDFDWTGWSRFKTQKVDFKKAELMDDFEVETGWRDTWDVRFGGDYELFDRFFVRAGTWYDQSATPIQNLEPGAMEMPRWAANVGFGYTWTGITLDLAYSHIWMKEAVVHPNDVPEVEIGDARGRYAASYDMIVVGLNFNFNEIIATFRGTRQP
jgi:long-chain fatty acid transport protein